MAERADSEGVGSRVAVARKLANLTQDQLAQRSLYSVHMVRAVEQAREPASPGFIAAVARALGVEPERLTGAPYVETLDAEGYQTGLRELRNLLAEGSRVRGVEPPSTKAIAQELAAIDVLRWKDKSLEAAERIPPVIRQIYGALSNAPEGTVKQQELYVLLTNAYCLAGSLLRSLGAMTLQISALDRFDWAAGLSGDPLWLAVAKVQRCRSLMYLDAAEAGLPLIDDALNLAEGDSENAMVIRGHAHLCAAITSARSMKVEAAREHVGAARTFASHVKGESDAYGTRFGAGNTAAHAYAVELEAGDPNIAAVEGSKFVAPADMAHSRVGHHWQDNARAWLMVGEPDKALKALHVARKIAPQQTRLHPSVRETVVGIAAAERRQSDTLGNFARWVGVSL